MDVRRTVATTALMLAIAAPTFSASASAAATPPQAGAGIASVVSTARSATTHSAAPAVVTGVVAVRGRDGHLFASPAAEHAAFVDLGGKLIGTPSVAVSAITNRA